ncbi:MAG: hypothetical protein HYV47_02170 [Candidatus Nealsonbacteria bacterium]|nr:hypothetical protein [Candidatus Nealsonbacteria bacterium]
MMGNLLRLDKIILLSLIFLGIFAYAYPVGAFLDVIPSLADMQLGALDFIDRIVATLFYLLIAALGSSIFITLTAGFLDWASTLSVGLSGNQLVQAGWSFLAGFTNMIFILIFIAIALSYIFKTETFGMKRALPRLILIAFLLNFSLLFVKIFVDVGAIVQNALKAALWGTGEGLAITVGRAIAGELKDTVIGYIPFFAAYRLTALIPFANVAAAWLFASAMLTNEIFFGTFSQTFILVAFGIIGGLIFLTYAILFLARIVAIWLLAIVSPLAFAAYILPKTEKFFQQWLKNLFQWVFFGVVAFFLMGLGLKLFAAVMDPPNIFSGRGFDLAGGYLKLVLLFVYLIFSLTMAKKFTPTAANAIWSVGELAVGAGTGFLTAQALRGTMRARLWERERRAEKLGALSGRELALQTRLRTEPMPTAERKALAQEFKGQRERRLIKKEMVEAQAGVMRSGLIEEQRKKLMTKIKDVDEDTAKSVLRAEMERHKQSPFRKANIGKSIALMKLMLEKGAENDSDFKSGMFNEASKAAGPDDFRKNTVRKAASARRPEWLTPGERETSRAGLNPADIDKWSKSSKENDTIIKEMVGTMRMDFITRLGSQTKVSIEKVQKEVDETLGKAWRDLGTNVKDAASFASHIATLDVDQRKKLILQLENINSLHSSPATRAWKKYGSIDKGDDYNVRDRIKELRKAMS